MFDQLHNWIFHAGDLHRDWRIYLLGWVSGASVMFAGVVVVGWLT